MRKVELSLKEKYKYETIKKLVETNGNKERARIKLKLKSIRQINRLIAGYKEFGKEFFVHGNRGRKPKHALTDEFKDEIETLYTSKYFDCTYTQFTEYLEERENIFLSVPEVGLILRDRYILSPRARKITKKNLKKKLLAEKEKTKSKKKLLNFNPQLSLWKMLTLDNLDVSISVKKFKLMLVYIFGLVIQKQLYMPLSMILLVMLLLPILIIKKL